DDAVQKVEKNVIEPNSKEIVRRLEGTTVNINPNRLKDISPGLDKYAKTLKKKPLDDRGRATITGPRAQRLKQQIDRRVKYKQQGIFQEGAETIDKTRKAKKTADILREKLANKDPAIRDLNSQMSDAFKKTAALQKGAKNKTGWCTHKHSFRGEPGLLYQRPRLS
ncbi:MAG: hypothetical protein MI865_08510, partial [Proteobacteria bacterium]|nr:hypothetical protein [Pseudomonadota bacterium]